MNLHTVTKHGQTKSGKPVVYLDGKTSFTDMVFLGNTAAPPVGAVIDTEMVSQSRDGKTFWFLNKWGMAPSDKQTPQPQAPDGWKPPTTNGLNAQQSATTAGYTEPERMFVSNIVAAAITSGKISDPVDLPAWINAALYALRHAKADLPMNGTTAGLQQADY